MNTSDWYGFVPIYTKKHRLLRVDFRNQGQSEYVEKPFNIDIHADDLKVLLDMLSIEKVHMIGVSYGGKVAMLFALKYQEMLHSLVLCNTSARVTKCSRDIQNSWTEAAKQNDGAKFFKCIMPFVYSPKFYEGNMRWVESREKAFAKALQKPWFEAFIKLTESSYSYDILDKISALEVPTLCIASEFDNLTPIEELKLIHDQIKGSKLLIIPDVGHAPQYENKLAFNKAVLSFIEA
jgi:pimeloyl-ACP methyl ester carboxylesterase